MFQGTFTAIITPFRDGQIDADAFKKHIDAQVAGGVEGIVPVGTTGESPTVDDEEHLEIIRLAVEFADKRIKVVAGTGANSTSEASHLTEEAERLGVDASLQVCPYYNKPPQEGLYQHFKAISESTQLPIMLYSIPGRSVIQIDVETVARLQQDCDNIISIKEAGGDPERVTQLRAALPDDFQILSGDDPLTIEFMKRGACGLVSVASNIIPQQMSDLVRAMNAKEIDKAQAIHDQYEPLLSTLMGIETNPIPIKAACEILGYCSSEIRLPMIALADDKKEILRKSLADFNLL